MYKNYNLKDDIKSTVKLSQIIGKKLSLKQRDKNNFVALCPFHKEKTPSFNISDDKGFYHCFGCGKNGDVFSFLMETENISFTEAMKRLADLTGIRLPNRDAIYDPKITILHNLLKRVSDSYRQNLGATLGQRARKYLKQRGIKTPIIEDFILGYSGNYTSNKYLVSCLLKEGFLLEDLIKVGLLKKTESGDIIFYFKERIMFPILSNSGKIIGFGGRNISTNNPKYLNSPETPLFQKGKELFGFYNSKKLLGKNKFIICEGYMDVISLNSYDYPSVASLGTSITEAQIEKIFNITDEAFLVFDGDDAGKNATMRVFDKYLPILRINKKLKFVFLPNKLDPDDFIKKFGVKQFEYELEKALNIIDLLWLEGLKLLKKNEPETNVLFWNYLRSKVRTIKDINIKLAFKDEIEKRIKIHRKDNLLNYSRSKFLDINTQKLLFKNQLPKTGVEIKIGAIIYMMITCPGLCLIYDEKISLLDFKDENYNKLKDNILMSIQNNPQISSDDLKKEIIKKGFTIQIEKFMQSNYSNRLNINENNITTETLDDTFSELLNLLNVNAV